MSQIPLLLLLLLLAATAGGADRPKRLPAGEWKTDFSKRSIDLDELQSGGPPKDGIPAIHNPKFVPPQQAAEWLHPKEPVLAVERGDDARAYPLQILLFHELVNDEIGGLPILVSFCPLCNSAITFDRRIDGKVYDFGVSGMLRHSDMVMYDLQTDSLWQQLTGEAIVGELTGKRLEIVSSQVVAFDSFQQAFPQGKVLSRETGALRPYGMSPYEGYEFGNRNMFPVALKRAISVRPMERLVRISIGGKTKAYPMSSLRNRRVKDGKIKKTRYVILVDPTALTTMDAKRIADSQAVGAVGVFSDEVDGKRLRFREKDGKIVDRETGSTWTAFGRAVEGPLAGKRLEPIEHGVFYAFAWMVFNPDTEIVGAPPAPRSERSIFGEPNRPGDPAGPPGTAPGGFPPAGQP